MLAHQPAIAGQYKMTEEERLEVTKSDLPEKAGGNVKEAKTISELEERQTKAK